LHNGAQDGWLSMKTGYFPAAGAVIRYVIGMENPYHGKQFAAGLYTGL
jgi:adenosylmethionine-8-amino-7-oxononanoate aminotransferase